MELPKVKSAEPVEDIAVAVTVTTQISERKSIVMQTYLPRDAALKDFHSALDKLGAAVDRQEAKYKLLDLKNVLVQHENTLKQLNTDYERIEAKAAADWAARGKQGSPKLNPNETSQKTTAEQNIKRYRVEIEKIKAEIAACEGLIAKDT